MLQLHIAVKMQSLLDVAMNTVALWCCGIWSDVNMLMRNSVRDSYANVFLQMSQKTTEKPKMEVSSDVYWGFSIQL